MTRPPLPVPDTAWMSMPCFRAARRTAGVALVSALRGAAWTAAGVVLGPGRKPSGASAFSGAGAGSAFFAAGAGLAFLGAGAGSAFLGAGAGSAGAEDPEVSMSARGVCTWMTSPGSP